VHFAAYGQCPDIMEAIHSMGGDLSLLDKKGWTPLHCAAAGANSEAAQFLLSHGQDINQVDKRGRSPLHLAAAHGNMEIVSALLDNGAKHLLDDNGWTPLDITSQSEYPANWKHTRNTIQKLAVTTAKLFPTRWSLDDRGAALEISDDGLAVELPSKLYTPYCGMVLIYF
jgi:hypothetical protein